MEGFEREGGHQAEPLKLRNWARISTNGIAMLLELARFIGETVSSEERFRVIVEYDPEAYKAIVSIWTRDGKHSEWECPELPRLAYPKAKEL